jgi:hypothetical protein
MPTGLPRFHSDSPNELADVFLRRFELSCIVNGYPQEQWGGALALHIDGSGFSTSVDLLSDPTVPWGAKREQFLVHFTPLSDTFTNMKALFRSASMASGESVAQFADRFHQTVVRARLDRDSDAVLALFEEGLHPGLRHAFGLASLRGNRPQSFIVARQLALECETVQVPILAAARAPAMSAPRRSGTSTGGSGNQACPFCLKWTGSVFRHAEDNCNRKARWMAEGSPPSGPSRPTVAAFPSPQGVKVQRPPGRAPSSVSSPSRASPAPSVARPCARCKAPDHWARDCPVARAAAALDFGDDEDPDEQTDEESSDEDPGDVEPDAVMETEQSPYGDEQDAFGLAAFGVGGTQQGFPQPGRFM